MKARFYADFINIEISPKGYEKVRFLFSANPGEPPRSLSHIASGGELSRVLLVLKTILAGKYGVKTLIFDEVDAGIGGSAGETIGRMLKKLSKIHQVICITHLPQIACFADRHFVVSKEVEGKRTVTRVKVVKGEERINEIARMLGGGQTAKVYAKQMLKSVHYLLPQRHKKVI